MDRFKSVDEIIEIISEIILSYIVEGKEEKQLLLEDEIPIT